MWKNIRYGEGEKSYGVVREIFAIRFYDRTIVRLSKILKSIIIEYRFTDGLRRSRGISNNFFLLIFFWKIIFDSFG